MRILVTGGHGFVGCHVVAALRKAGHTLSTPSHEECNLLSGGNVWVLFNNLKLDAVIHLAAVVGGIGANQLRPADFWLENLQMGMNILEACAEYKVKRVIMAGTTCSYPKMAPIPFIEERLFEGRPEDTNAPYGIAKLALIEGAAAYKRQYGLDTVTLVPTNLYGPGDHFDLTTSHVIPALIRKMHEAKRDDSPEVGLWGDGSASRDFLYVTDVAEAFVKAVETNGLDPVINVGSGEEVTIRETAEAVRKIVGYNGEICWDKSKPNGQPRRCLDINRARHQLKWCPSTRLVDGLEKTYRAFLGGE